MINEKTASEPVSDSKKNMRSNVMTMDDDGFNHSTVDAFNQATTEGGWSDVREKIKTKWDKIDSKDVESFKGNLDLLPVHIQKLYGISKEKADHEFNEFKATLYPKQADEKSANHNSQLVHTHDDEGTDTLN